MRIVHRIMQSLAFAPALAGIASVSPAVSRAQGATATTITLVPTAAVAGQSVMINVHVGKQNCDGGMLSFGDGSKDFAFGRLNAGSTVSVPHVFAVGSWVIHSYFNPDTTASLKEPEKSAANMIFTASCKGGPVTLKVTAPGAPSTTGAGLVAVCNDGTIWDDTGPNACQSHGGIKQRLSEPNGGATYLLCVDGTIVQATGMGACQTHRGIKGVPNTQYMPPASPTSPNTNTTGTPCNDGTVSSTTGKGACEHHGGIKRTTTPNAPPPPPPSPNTNTTGTPCNDGTVSTTTGKGACAHHGGIKRDSTAKAPPAGARGNT